MVAALRAELEVARVQLAEKAAQVDAVPHSVERVTRG